MKKAFDTALHQLIMWGFKLAAGMIGLRKLLSLSKPNTEGRTLLWKTRYSNSKPFNPEVETL
jgi:hypothetical protein